MTKTDDVPVAEALMTRQVKTVTADMNLAQIIAYLVKHRVSNVPVVKHEGNDAMLVGFISEGDCLEHLSNEVFYGWPVVPQTAETIMRRHPVCVTPDADMFTLASILDSHRLRHLPVVDRGKLVGIVSRHDVLKGLDKYYRNTSREQLAERFPPDLHKIINHRFITENS